MKFKDLSQKKEFTKFIPTHLIEEEDIPVNERQENWLESWEWYDTVNTIIKLPEDFVYVVYYDVHDGHPTTSLYKGTLE